MNRFQLRNKLYCVVGWPVLLVFDLGIALSGAQPWAQARKYSKQSLTQIWNRVK